MIYYTLDEWGRCIGQSAEPTARCTIVAPPDAPGAWIWNDYAWIDSPATGTPPPAASASVQLPRQITPLSFLRRFWPAERVAIDLASIGDTVQAATVRMYMQNVQLARYIDLDAETTAVGIQAMCGGGLLTAERGAAILDAPIQPEELP